MPFSRIRQGSGFFPLPLGVAWLLFGLKHIATPLALYFVAKAIAFSRVVRFGLIEFAVSTGLARFPLGGVFDLHPFHLLSILVRLQSVSIMNLHTLLLPGSAIHSFCKDISNSLTRGGFLPLPGRIVCPSSIFYQTRRLCFCTSGELFV